MTVKELKQHLNSYPDDYQLTVQLYETKNYRLELDLHMIKDDSKKVLYFQWYAPSEDELNEYFRKCRK